MSEPTLFKCHLCGASYPATRKIGTLDVDAVPDDLETDKNHPWLVPGYFLRCHNWTECGERNPSTTLPPSAMNLGGTFDHKLED